MGILSANSSHVRTKPGGKLASKATQGAVDWHESIRLAIRSENELLDLLRLPARIVDKHSCKNETEAQIQAAVAEFPVFVPREFVARMQPGDPNDPLLLQVLPRSQEALEVDGYLRDPVGDQHATLAEGVIQKYHGRALLITTGVCAVHCRYCFRRHFPYSASNIRLESMEPAIRKLAEDPGLEEVILSGGDPLMMKDEWLRRLVERISRIPQVRRLRIHTRLPIMIPGRVTPELIDWLTSSRMTPIVVLHINHAQELKGDDVVASIQRLINAGVPLLNQSVLLRGINDHVESMADLCRELVDLRVMPYYLHLLDRVAGAAHFDVSEEQGVAIIESLRRILPGYAVPRLAKEVAGEPGKNWLA